MTSILKKAVVSIFSLLAVMLLGGCEMGSGDQEKPEQTEIFVMSTYVSQQVYGKQKMEATQSVNKLLRELDETLSLFAEGSEISKINQNAGISPVKVNDYTFDLIRVAKRYSLLSGGADSERRFDITIAPVSLLWGIDTDHAQLPEPRALTQALALVDCTRLQLDEEERTVYLEEKGMALDLGGIAKGYLAGRIHEEYEKYGVESALVSIGGNLCIYGKKPGNVPFKVGIRDPLKGQTSAVMGTLTVPENLVLSTTGGYERYFEQDGVRYHHILDPQTGYPADSDLLSVTVLCEDGGLADYLSTTLYIAGKEAVPSYLNDSRFDVIVVDQEGNVQISDRIRPWFSLTANGYQMEEAEVVE